MHLTGEHFGIISIVVGFLSFLILGFVTVYGCVLVVADLRSKERGVERGESHTEKERRDKSLVREWEGEREEENH